MGNVLVDEQSLTDIADAIREKNGTEDTYKPSEMGDAVRAIESGDSWYDTFWDAYQENGERVNYEKAFAGGIETMNSKYVSFSRWVEETLKPKYDMKPKNSREMFYACTVEDIMAIFEDNDITIDFSNCLCIYGMYKYCLNVKKIPPFNDCSKLSNVNSGEFVRNCTALETLEMYNLPDHIYHTSYNIWKNTLLGCSSLKNVILTGIVGNSISFTQSPLLTAESAKNVINVLKNYKYTDYEGLCTVSFHGDTWALLDAEGEASPNGNTWKDYVNDIGWIY